MVKPRVVLSQFSILCSRNLVIMARVTRLTWLAHYAEDESLQQFVIAQSSDWPMIMFPGV